MTYCLPFVRVLNGVTLTVTGVPVPTTEDVLQVHAVDLGSINPPQELQHNRMFYQSRRFGEV